MSLHTYPRPALVGDYVRAGAGLALTALPLAFVPMHWVLAVLFAGAALLFSLFLTMTVQKHLTVVETDEEGIVSRGPAETSIPWSELSRLKLTYYSTRRDRQDGWMTLVLKGRGRKISLESSLSAFDTVAERAHRAAEARGLALSSATHENLMALGVRRPSGRLAARWGPDEEADDAERERAG